MIASYTEIGSQQPKMQANRAGDGCITVCEKHYKSYARKWQNATASMPILCAKSALESAGRTATFAAALKLANVHAQNSANTAFAYLYF
jgi:hypothetical protein